jgi:hypothetical protein
MESALQLFFDYLTVSQKLWKQSGAGIFHRKLRPVDIDYIKSTGDLSPKFMVGITIISNVSVVEQEIDINGKEIVKFVTAGAGVKCSVHQPKMSTPIMTKSQESARAAAYDTLTRNFKEQAAHKRKIDVMLEDVLVCQ